MKRFRNTHTHSHIFTCIHKSILQAKEKKRKNQIKLAKKTYEFDNDSNALFNYNN